MIDWLKKRLSPVKKDSPRWKELAESIQEFWADNFDPNYDVLAGLRSIYTADVTNQRRLAVEMGHYFEDGTSDENIPASVAMRKMELHQKETNVPLVRSMSRIGFVAEWAPLYAPSGEIYGTAFYTENELEANGLRIDAEMIRLDGSWHVGDDPASHLTSDGVYMTSRAKMVLDLSSGRVPAMIDVARRRIMQVKPLHIVFDGFKYRIWLEISSIPTHEMQLRMTKTIDQFYPWGTPKLNGLWKIGTNITVPHRHLDGTWTLNGADLGSYLISGAVYQQLSQRTVIASMAMRKDIGATEKCVTARIGESFLKLDGEWHVGGNPVLTLAEMVKIFTKLGQARATLDGANDLDGSWYVGVTKHLDGSWHVGEGRA